jgi:hypothetical protein
MKMIIINNRNELHNFLYEGKEVDTLVGIAKIGGELLEEAISNEYKTIFCFFPMGDEGEFITVDDNGNVVENSIYY